MKKTFYAQKAYIIVTLLLSFLLYQPRVAQLLFLHGITHPPKTIIKQLHPEVVWELFVVCHFK